MTVDKELSRYISGEKFYKPVVEDGADLIIITDYEGNIVYSNPSVKETLNYKPSDLLGRNFFEFIHEDDVSDLKTNFKEVIKEEFTYNIEFRFLCKDSEYMYLEFNSINLKHKNKIKGIILDCRDISQRKKDAEELVRAKKTKEEFLARMSHEIRTPINGIAGMINLLMESKLTPDQEKFLNGIKSSAENLKVIINDILDLSVIESGHLTFERIGFNPEHQIKSVLESFSYQAEEKGLSLDYKVMKRADRVLIGDPVRLNQVLINLISNSIKFTNSGDIFIKADVNKVEDNTVFLEITVADTGAGIKKDKLEGIFEAFKQADETVTRKHGGTGLGLAICKQLVELQGGYIEVSSKIDIGSEFRFVIPYQKGTEDDLATDTPQKLKTRDESLKNIKTLLVEDNDINMLYAKNILKKFNCVVDVAENGLIALEKLRKNDYDIILMDVQMPVMDGFEATRSIRESFPASKKDIPIIALTANALKGDDVRCIEAGMNGYVSKPFNPDELFSVIYKQIKKESKMPEPSRVHEEKEPYKTDRSTVTDLNYLTSVSNNDQNFIREMVEVFLDSVPRTTRSFHDNLDTDWDQVYSAAHKIKPSITFMGIKSLHDVIRKIEENAKERKNLDQIPGLVDQFESTANQACKELKDYLNS